MSKLILLFIISLVFLSNCSFDNKTGLWGAGKEEKERISQLEQQQREVINTKQIYKSEDMFNKEIDPIQSINIKNFKKVNSWKMSNLNHQNDIGNILLPTANNIFFKKKIGKNKSKIIKSTSSPIIFNNSIFISDDRGNVFNTNLSGQINWKQNIYNKLYKRINKNLDLAIFENNIYISDNVGFIYALNAKTGELLWIKNHGIPLKSNIKVMNKKIYLINQDNRIICLDVKDGSLIWNFRSISSFIKSQNLLSIALTKKGDVVALSSYGDLFKINGKNGNVYWSTNTSFNLLAHSTDFFKSSKIVINKNNVIFSSGQIFYSYNLSNGYLNWEKNYSSVGAPIIENGNIFLVTENGYFLVVSQDSGKIILSKNILNSLKKRKQDTRMAGFIMGSGKIYSTTINGFLIITSAKTGINDNFVKIGDPISTSPIIYNKKLYILTQNSKIIVLN